MRRNVSRGARGGGGAVTHKLTLQVSLQGCENRRGRPVESRPFGCYPSRDDVVWPRLSHKRPALASVIVRRLNDGGRGPRLPASPMGE